LLREAPTLLAAVNEESDRTQQQQANCPRRRRAKDQSEIGRWRL
jgi:hypothetical protein